MAKTKKAVTEKQVPKEPPSRKRVVQADSSDDEASASDKHQGRAHMSGPQGKAQARAKVAKGKAKRAVLSDDDDEEEEEEEFSEAEESDDDFESDEDDDFKGKKGKGKKKLPDIGKKQSGKGKKHADAKTTPASRGDRSSASGKKPSHCNPPVLPCGASPAVCLSLLLWHVDVDLVCVARRRKWRLRVRPLGLPSQIRTRKRQQGERSCQNRKKPWRSLNSVILESKLLWVRAAHQALRLCPLLFPPRFPRHRALPRPLAS